MALKDKYSEVVNAAKTAGVTNLEVREQDNVLYIDGIAPTNDVKQKLWDLYGKIDPDYRSGDVIMNISVANSNGGTKELTRCLQYRWQCFF